MTRPTDASIARAFSEVSEGKTFMVGAPISSFVESVLRRAAEFDAESPAGTSIAEMFTINESPCIPKGMIVASQGGEIKGIIHSIPTEPAKRTCTRPTCRAEMRPGLRCGSPHCGLKE